MAISISAAYVEESRNGENNGGVSEAIENENGESVICESNEAQWRKRKAAKPAKLSGGVAAAINESGQCNGGRRKWRRLSKWRKIIIENNIKRRQRRKW